MSVSIIREKVNIEWQVYKDYYRKTIFYCADYRDHNSLVTLFRIIIF